MLAFRRKKFVGSYRSFSAVRRGYSNHLPDHLASQERVQAGRRGGLLLPLPPITEDHASRRLVHDETILVSL